MCPITQGDVSVAIAGGAQSARPTTPPSFVPPDALSISAFDHAAQDLHPAVLNHSIRVYLYAHALATRISSPWIQTERLPLLFTACILHDIGTCAVHNGPQRFEVEGADAAVEVVTQHEYSEADAHEVWVAIALHSSPGLGERISPLARLVRVAVLRDFGVTVPAVAAGELAVNPDDPMKAMVQKWEEQYPRQSIEKVLGDAVVEQALKVGTREKAPPATWPGNLLRAYNEDPKWQGVNKGF